MVVYGSDFATPKHCGSITDKTLIDKVVYDEQLYDRLPSNLFTDLDGPVDLIVTPTKFIRVAKRLPRPSKTRSSGENGNIIDEPAGSTRWYKQSKKPIGDDRKQSSSEMKSGSINQNVDGQGEEIDPSVPTKRSLRLKTYRKIENKRCAPNPYSIYNRVPNFIGAAHAVTILSEIDEYKNAKNIKVNSDKAQSSLIDSQKESTIHSVLRLRGGMETFNQLGGDVDNNCDGTKNMLRAVLGEIRKLSTTQQTLQTSVNEMKTTLHTLQTSVNEMKTTQQTLQTSFNEMKTTQQTLQTSVNEMKTTQQTLQTSVNEMKTTQQTLQASVNEMKTTQQTLQTSVNEMKTSITEIKTIVQSLQTSDNRKIEKCMKKREVELALKTIKDNLPPRTGHQQLETLKRANGVNNNPNNTNRRSRTRQQ